MQEGLLILTPAQSREWITRAIQEAIPIEMAKFQKGDQKEKDELITSIEGISKLFNCSIPKAQAIKNSIPRTLYWQSQRKFAISREVLLSNSGKRGQK